MNEPSLRRPFRGILVAREEPVERVVGVGDVAVERRGRVVLRQAHRSAAHIDAVNDDELQRRTGGRTGESIFRATLTILKKLPGGREGLRDPRLSEREPRSLRRAADGSEGAARHAPVAAPAHVAAAGALKLSCHFAPSRHGRSRFPAQVADLLGLRRLECPPHRRVGEERISRGDRRNPSNKLQL